MKRQAIPIDTAAPVLEVVTLARREAETVLLLSRGLTNQEIASVMQCQLATVKARVGTLLRDLDLRNRVELTRWALQNPRAQERYATPTGRHHESCRCDDCRLAA